MSEEGKKEGWKIRKETSVGEILTFASVLTAVILYGTNVDGKTRMNAIKIAHLEREDKRIVSTFNAGVNEIKDTIKRLDDRFYEALSVRKGPE